MNQIDNGQVAGFVNLNIDDLKLDIHQLQTETFEIEEVNDLEANMAMSSSSCSTSSCCSCSTSSCCSTSSSTSSTSSCN